MVLLPSAMLLCALQEIRRIWVGYWSQADAQLGQRLAAKLQAGGAL
jgi:catalase